MTDLPRVSSAPHPLLACSLALLLPLTSACDDPGATSGSTDPASPTTRTAPTDEPVADPPPEAEPAGGPRLRTVYVPAYSVLPRGTNLDRSALLSVLLSVRNVDSTATVTLTHVDYFDTSGHRVRRYLDAPRRLRPLETAEFTVETNDATGGSR